MYEHPYLTQRAAELELARIEQQLERRRFIAEHADQIVRRPAGRFRRMLGRIVGRTDAAPDRGRPAARLIEARTDAARTDAARPDTAKAPSARPHAAHPASARADTVRADGPRLATLRDEESREHSREPVAAC